MSEVSKKKITVVMGGTSSEAAVSRRSGAAILAALKEKGYNAEGLELNPDTFYDDIKKSGAAMVFNALHGRYGEDGILQGTLDMLDIPYTGSDVLAASLTMDKAMAKRVFAAENIPTPRYKIFGRGGDAQKIAAEIRREFNLPVVIKAASQGSSIGVYIVEKDEELDKAAEDAVSYGDNVLAEEFIKGRELTVAVYGETQSPKAMPVIEITTLSGRYDYESKYTVGASTHIVPAPISDEKTAEAKSIAEKTFTVCGCRGVARIDMMMNEAGELFVIEVNSVPGMTETSLVPDAARSMGLSFPDLCEKILLMAGFVP